VVGSLHHVRDIPFDYNRTSYDQAVQQCGGLGELYAAYFDDQYEMIQSLRPRVVGHLDIIRIYDSDYRSRLLKSDIWRRIVRNLEAIKQLNLILDYNVRPLSKGASEPYLAGPILEKAVELGVDIVPGDDSHGIDDIGRHWPIALKLLRAAGVSMRWREPVDAHPDGR
jgi:histidinol-phosphatase (PHP family)